MKADSLNRDLRKHMRRGEWKQAEFVILRLLAHWWCSEEEPKPTVAQVRALETLLKHIEKRIKNPPQETREEEKPYVFEPLAPGEQVGGDV